MPPADILAMLDEVTASMAYDWQSASDGGWAADLPQAGIDRPSDVWSTAEVVLWLSQYDTDRFQTQIDDGLGFLANTQHVEENVVDSAIDSGWGWHVDRPSDPTSTTMALLAFVRHVRRSQFGWSGAGAQPLLRNLESARDWLISHRNPDGGWSLIPQEHSSAFNTCWASIALSESLDVVGLEDPRIAASILPTSLSLVESSRKAGGWGDTLSHPADAVGTGYCTYLLQHMDRHVGGGPGVNWLLLKQANNGSWEPGPAQSPVEATAWAVQSLLSSPNRRALRLANAIDGGLSYLRNLYIQHAGWPERPGGPPKLWATYYACLALLATIDAEREDEGADGLKPSRRRKKVFIVHGHHAALRAEVKAIVQRLDLDPVVLEEKPNNGLSTITDKFEYYAKDEGVDYALVLCTPDDMISSENAMGPRGNVLLELGWFMAKLDRERVCVLLDPAVRLPSDIGNIAYINIRQEGWQEQLAQQLRVFKQIQEAKAASTE